MAETSRAVMPSLSDHIFVDIDGIANAYQKKNRREPKEITENKNPQA